MQKHIRVIQSIQRAFDIINCFDYQNSKLTLLQISNMLNLNINTVRGIVNTLVANGFLEHNIIQNTYSLGLIYIPKAELVNSSVTNDIKNIAEPYMHILSEKYNVSTRLQLVNSWNIFTVESVSPEKSHYIVYTRINTVLPFNATASGKIFLSYMDSEKREAYYLKMDKTKYTENTLVSKQEIEQELIKIKNQGYSLELEEIDIGVSSIAAPILLNKNKLFGTISVTGTSPMIKKLIDKNIVYDILEYTKIISCRISGNNN